ncbi:hypothetical protein F4W66_25255 (plasmid) [Escherichia coli]|nr:hypothetical protein F4W66_25255 [Escherichia coli]
MDGDCRIEFISGSGKELGKLVYPSPDELAPQRAGVGRVIDKEMKRYSGEAEEAVCAGINVDDFDRKSWRQKPVKLPEKCGEVGSRVTK